MQFYIQVLLLMFFLPILAYASNNETYASSEMHAQKVIDACQSLSQPRWNSGDASEMMEGSYNYIQCLSDEITDIAEIYFIDTKMEDKEKFLKRLKVHTESSYEVYWLLFHGACNPCGTMYRGMHINSAAGELENILKTMLRNAYEHDRLVESLSAP